MHRALLIVPTLLCAVATAQHPDDARWRAVADGPDAPVWALASYQGQIVAGGFFQSAGGTPALGIARWDGASWSALGSGITGSGRGGSVMSLYPFAGSLVAGGDFGAAGGQPTSGVASWNGTAWTPLPGIGFPGERIGPFTTYAGELVATGVFDRFIKRWNGSSWVTLEEDAFAAALAGNAFALCTFGGELIAAAPSAASPPAAGSLSAWNGSAWRPVASANGEVFAVVVHGGELFAAGSFTSIGGIVAKGVARFDGGSWHPLGSGLDGTVFALTVLHGRLFAGGDFVTAGGAPARCVARWDGASWAPLGSGVTSPFSQVRALAVSGDDLLVGGAFTAIAGQPTANLAVWHDPSDTLPPNVTILAPAPGVLVNATTVAVAARVDDASPTTVTSVPAGVAGSLPAGGGVATGNVPLAQEGDNEITVGAVDAFGNQGGTAFVVTRDTIAPSIASLTPASGTVVGSATVDVHVVVQDVHASTVSFGAHVIPVPAGGGTASGSVQLLEGRNEIPISVVDAAGNLTPTSLTLELDTTAPVVAITEPAANAGFGVEGRTIVVRASVTDASATYVTLEPGGAFATVPPGTPSPFSGQATLQEGANTILVSARDATGHVGAHAIVVTLDTTPPIVTVLSPLDGSAVGGSVDFHAAAQDPPAGGASGSGVAAVSLAVDGEPVAAAAETVFDTRTLGDGLHTFTATAVDARGNASTPAAVTVRVDNTAPAVAILEPAAQEVVAGTRRVRASANDAGSGLVALTLTTEGAVPVLLASFAWPAPVSADVVQVDVNTQQFADGFLTLVAAATDAAGNVSTSRTTVLVRNAAPPTCTLTPGDGSVVSAIVPLTATVTGAFTTVELKVDGASLGSSPASPFTVPFDTRTRLDGSMTVQAVVTDAFGVRSRFTVLLDIDNVSCELSPTVLNLKSKGDPLHVRLEGANVALLLPTEASNLQLRVPGGSPVPAEVGWNGDDVLSDGDHDDVPELTVRFSRVALGASIRAGLAAGAIADDEDVPVTIVAGAGTAEERVLQVVRVRIVGR